MAPIDAHRRRADSVRAAVTGEKGVAAASLRAAVMARAAGGVPTAEPFDALGRQIGEAAYRVTDAQVAAVRAATDDDKEAFEVVMAACVGAGLARWDAAIRAIEETADATT